MAGEARNLTPNVKVKIDNVRRVFNTRNGEMVALNGVSLDIMENEFITVVDSDYEYGASLKYTPSADAKGVHYVKWLDIKPNTDYTFSMNVNVLESGLGSVVLMAGKKRGSQPIVRVDFSQFQWGDEWFRVT